MEEQRFFRTIRGFFTGDEPDEENHFAYSATLRIFGIIPDLAQLTADLRIEPTYSHRRGERRGERSPPYKQDTWLFSPPVPETEPLETHIEALWAAIKDRKEYLLKLKESMTVDVFLGYRSNCDHAGIEIPHTCLAMFIELQIPFGLSIIIA